jgi:putative hydrolase of the HAD superfamily
VTRHLLLDFFGTLVAYDPSRVAQGFPRSHALMPHLPYADFLAVVDTAFAELDAIAADGDTEYSMTDAAARILDRPAGDPAVAAFEQAYLAEWSAAVTPLPGITGFLAAMAARFRLVVVSNTHSPRMVPDMLERMGAAHLVDDVVLSVDLGHRKPHPSVYAAALAGADPADAVFCGDSFDADYAGPAAAGIPAYLIDPAGTSAAPPDRRLTSVFDLLTTIA